MIQFLRNGAAVAVGHDIYDVDVLMVDGAGWLAPSWTVSADGKTMAPACLIPLARLPHSDAGADAVSPRFVVQLPLSLSLLEGRPTADEVRLFGIQSGPQISLPNPDALN